ncbi:MAG TPA: trypsin-like peptidase domain-containing protein [Dehalococcoidia bacterium]|nr:trypsin-like peptidase domain-containing protein [Dehalococcoidia bacterium]
MKRLTWLPLAALALTLAAAACGGKPSAPAAGPTPSATARTPAAAGSTAALVQRLRPSVVQILSEAATLDIFGQPVPSQGAGTGFIIDNDGHIVTNNHVVVQPDSCDQPAQKITVTLSDGRKSRASIVGRDVPTDLAVLKIDATGLTPVTFGDSSSLQVGDDVIAIGNALNLPGGPTVTKGVISANDRLIQESQCAVSIPGAVQTDAAINPGNSGGPLVDMRGRVVAITTAIISQAEPGVQAQGIGLAISSATAKPIIDELIGKGRVDRGSLGVRIVEITPSLAQSFDLPVDHGIGLRSVQRGGPADDAGLQSGDIIVKLADIDVSTSGDLFRALTEHRAGEKVTVEYYRDGAKKTAEVTLG